VQSAQASRDIPVIAIVGVPVSVDNLLFNCVAVVYQGRLLGLVPKTYLPNYREFYELRQFTPADARLRDSIDLIGQRDVPFGNQLLFHVENKIQTSLPRRPRSGDTRISSRWSEPELKG
jgi:NAD+ synthase (glutamine-hydrolysing)